MTAMGHLRQFRTLGPAVLVMMISFSCAGRQGLDKDASRNEPPAYEGYHDYTSCSVMVGWAWDSRRPNDPVRVDIYEGDTLLASVTANVFRKDLLDAHKGNGRHGFSYRVPPRLQDGKQHSLRVKFAGTNIDLQSTPRTINCNFGD